MNRNRVILIKHLGTMTENRVILIKHPGTIAEKRVILTKYPGTITVFCEILLRNGVLSSEFAKICSGTGDNHQNSRNSAQERGTIIRIREILLRN